MGDLFTVGLFRVTAAQVNAVAKLVRGYDGVVDLVSDCSLDDNTLLLVSQPLDRTDYVRVPRRGCTCDVCRTIRIVHPEAP